MPRKPRIQSQTDTYHVMMRGSNKQQVFYDTEDREYSSMREYMGLQKGITDTELALSLLNRADLIAFCQQDSSDRFLDMFPATTRPSDDKALALIREEFGPQIELPENREQLGSAVSHLLASGLSIRQISRLSGISKGFIERSQRWHTHNGCI